MGGRMQSLLIFSILRPRDWFGIGSGLARDCLGNGSVKSGKDFFLQKGYALYFGTHDVAFMRA